MNVSRISLKSCGFVKITVKNKTVEILCEKKKYESATPCVPVNASQTDALKAKGDRAQRALTLWLSLRQACDVSTNK